MLAELEILTWVLIGALVLLVLLVLVLLRFLNLWVQAYMSGTKIGLFQLVGMSLRKVNPTVIVRGAISATQAGLPIVVRDLEAHYLAGGNVTRVVNALIAADRANLGLDFRQAAAIDLAGRDVLDAVQTSVKPKVIDCPADGKVAAMAKNGIQVLAKARVTVRTNIKRLVGGATEETIIARVNEGIVTSIGSAVSHKDVLENPDHISRRVLERGLDANTQFEILSIDIADVDVGQNIGATLQASQAEADKQVAQARAEVRRAAAVATEQEMSARTQEMRAKLVEAEALIPIAMAEAFRNGNLGIMDYARYRNVVADTEMRTSIANEVKEDEDSKGASNKV
jgi:uncharacterized protein YqfA (UPF0365 family)